MIDANIHPPTPDTALMISTAKRRRATNDSPQHATLNGASPRRLFEPNEVSDGDSYVVCAQACETSSAKPVALPPQPEAYSNHEDAISRRHANHTKFRERVLEGFRDFSAWLPSNLEQTQWTALCQLFAVPVSGLDPLHIASVLGEGFDKLRAQSTASGVDVTTSNGLTPLMAAALNPVRASETIAHLLALRADPKKKFAQGQNALHVAAIIHDNPTALAPLIEAGLDPFAKTDVEPGARSSLAVPSPLYQASTRGRVNNVLYMLSLASPGEGHATTALLASQAGGQHHLYSVLCQKFPHLMDIPALPLEDAKTVTPVGCIGAVGSFGSKPMDLDEK